MACRAHLARSDDLLHVLLAALLAAPFFAFTYIPLHDLPNHVARLHLLFDGTIPGAPAYYAAHWRLLPNLALEGVVFLLHGVVSTEMAARVFLAATAVQLLLGTLALNRALFGKDARFALAACLFVFNGPFLLGLVNLTFGVGMALWVFALWLRWRMRAWSWAVFSLLSTVILLCHLFAFGVFAAALASFSLARRWNEAWRDGESRGSALLHAARQSLRDLLPLAAPLFLYLAVMPRELQGSSAYNGPWQHKLVALLSVDASFDDKFDLICLAAVLAGVILVRRSLIVSRAMIAPLSCFAAAFLLLPHQLGTATLVDYRVPTIALLFFIASTAWRAGSDRVRRRTEIAIVALFALRMAVLATQWAAWQPILGEYRLAFAKLPIGAKLLPLDPFAASIPRSVAPLGHIAALAVSDRSAFIPSLFANPVQQPLIYNPPYAALFETVPTTAHLAFYDYVLLIHPELSSERDLPEYEVIDRGRSFILGRLIH